MAFVPTGYPGLPNRWSKGLASLGEGGVHDLTKFGVQAAVSAALVN